MVLDCYTQKKYLVYGASSGLGRKIALRLRELGARVVLVGRNKERLQEVASHFSPENVSVQVNDLSSFEQAYDSVIQAVKWDKAKLNGCVFSAGISELCPLRTVNEEMLKRMFATNFFSLVAILKAFSSRRLSCDCASFVSISSRAGLMPDKSNGIYAATKAAINAYTITASKELAARKIRVNSICPELVKTPMAKDFIENIPSKILGSIYPLGLLEDDDVANVVIFLLGDGSKKITGQAIWLSSGNDGGNIDGNIF